MRLSRPSGPRRRASWSASRPAPRRQRMAGPIGDYAGDLLYRTLDFVAHGTIARPDDGLTLRDAAITTRSAACRRRTSRSGGSTPAGASSSGRSLRCRPSRSPGGSPMTASSSPPGEPPPPRPWRPQRDGRPRPPRQLPLLALQHEYRRPHRSDVPRVFAAIREPSRLEVAASVRGAPVTRFAALPTHHHRLPTAGRPLPRLAKGRSPARAAKAFDDEPLGHRRLGGRRPEDETVAGGRTMSHRSVGRVLSPSAYGRILMRRRRLWCGLQMTGGPRPLVKASGSRCAGHGAVSGSAT